VSQPSDRLLDQYLDDPSINATTVRTPNLATAAIALPLPRAFAQTPIKICGAEGVTGTPNFRTGIFGLTLPIASDSPRSIPARLGKLDNVDRGG
jgi:hypothetical protein